MTIAIIDQTQIQKIDSSETHSVPYFFIYEESKTMADGNSALVICPQTVYSKIDIIFLKWQYSGDCDVYKVERSTNNEDSWQIVYWSAAC